VILVFRFFLRYTCFFSKNCTINYYRFISRNGYRTRWIFHEGNRDATSKRDTRSRLLLIYQAMYCRAIRTHFAFSFSTVQTKVCKLTSSDLNIYTNVHRSVSRTYTSFIQLDKCVQQKRKQNNTVQAKRDSAV